MPYYECVYIARSDISASQVDTLTEDLEKLVGENGGKVTRTEYWGLKTLAYRIKKNRKGHYSMLNVDAPAAALAEMERSMRLNEDIIRYMSIKVGGFEEGPSIMMQSRSGRGRGRRGRDRDDEKGAERGEASRKAEAPAPGAGDGAGPGAAGDAKPAEDARPTEGAAPAAEGAKPAEDTAPAAEDTAPAAEDTAPAAEDTAPAAEDTAPAAEDTAPAAEDAKPTEDAKPAEEARPADDGAGDAGPEGAGEKREETDQ